MNLSDLEKLENAAAILDGDALTIRQCHNLNWQKPDWKDEPAAKADHDQRKRLSAALYELAEREKARGKAEDCRECER